MSTTKVESLPKAATAHVVPTKSTISREDAFRVTLLVIGVLSIIAGFVTQYAFHLEDMVYLPLYIGGAVLTLPALIHWALIKCKKAEKTQTVDTATPAPKSSPEEIQKKFENLLKSFGTLSDKDHTGQLQELIVANPSLVIMATDASGRTILHRAIIARQHDLVAAIHAKYPNAKDLKDGEGNTALQVLEAQLVKVGPTTPAGETLIEIRTTLQKS